MNRSGPGRGVAWTCGCVPPERSVRSPGRQLSAFLRARVTKRGARAPGQRATREARQQGRQIAMALVSAAQPQRAAAAAEERPLLERGAVTGEGGGEVGQRAPA